MSSIVLRNETDEPIEIEPNEVIRLFGEMDIRKVESQRRKFFSVESQNQEEYYGSGPKQEDLPL